jgi:hypothetical protein
MSRKVVEIRHYVATSAESECEYESESDVESDSDVEWDSDVDSESSFTDYYGRREAELKNDLSLLMTHSSSVHQMKNDLRGMIAYEPMGYMGDRQLIKCVVEDADGQVLSKTIVRRDYEEYDESASHIPLTIRFEVNDVFQCHAVLQLACTLQHSSLLEVTFTMGGIHPPLLWFSALTRACTNVTTVIAEKDKALLMLNFIRYLLCAHHQKQLEIYYTDSNGHLDLVYPPTCCVCQSCLTPPADSAGVFQNMYDQLVYIENSQEVTNFPYWRISCPCGGSTFSLESIVTLPSLKRCSVKQDPPTIKVEVYMNTHQSSSQTTSNNVLLISSDTIKCVLNSLDLTSPHYLSIVYSLRRLLLKTTHLTIVYKYHGTDENKYSNYRAFR